MAVDFGEVRSALHAAQDKAGWERLCEVCERADEREWEEQLWPYLEREITRWPLALRKVSPRWVRQAMEHGRTPPAARMGAALKVALTKQSWTGAFDLRHLAKLAHPGLVAASLSVEGLDPLKLQELLDVSAFVSSERLSGLRELELGGLLASEDALVRVAHNSALSALEDFGLGGVALGAAHINALTHIITRRQLDALHLTGCEGINAQLGRAAFWRQITSLELADDKYRGDYDPSFAQGLPANILKNLTLCKLRQIPVYHTLLNAPATDQLEILSIDQCYQLDHELLLKRMHGWQLRALRWTSCDLKDDVYDALTRELSAGDLLVRAEALDLDQAAQRAFLAVADAISLPALRGLRLESTLDGAQLAQLTRARLPALRHLHVRLNTSEKDEVLAAAHALSESSWAAQLDSLRVGAYHFYDLALDGLGALRPGVARYLYRRWDEPLAPLWDMRGVLIA